jgi:hypothetical protein
MGVLLGPRDQSMTKNLEEVTTDNQCEPMCRSSIDEWKDEVQKNRNDSGRERASASFRGARRHVGSRPSHLTGTTPPASKQSCSPPEAGPSGRFPL